MRSRLDVLLPDDLHEEIRRRASLDGVSVSEWVRRELRRAASLRSERSVSERLAALHEAAGYAFPTCDIEQMLAESLPTFCDDEPPVE